jgi:endonuclease/exonuclease/phosphatase family metal-dependent hydrolase
MPVARGRRTKRIFITLTILAVIPFLATCLVPFVASSRSWPLAFLGLVFPFLFVIVVVFLLGWAIARSKWVLLPLIALLIGLQQIRVTFAWRTSSSFNSSKNKEAIRILSWNVSRWDEGNKARRGGTSYRNEMLKLVQQQNADIICLQEFFECKDPRFFEENIPVLQQMGYPYYYFRLSSTRFNGSFQYGLIVFSKFPIIDSAGFANDAGKHSEGLMYVDVKMNNNVFRVFNGDLESAAFTRQDNADLEGMRGAGNLVAKLKNGYRMRSRQAENARHKIKSSIHPVIFCADLNDIPNSYTYFTVKNSLQDAFLKKGRGPGRTLRYFSPTLRIDYIFTDRKFKVEQFKRAIVPYSDHYPLIADIIFQP